MHITSYPRNVFLGLCGGWRGKSACRSNAICDLLSYWSVRLFWHFEVRESAENPVLRVLYSTERQKGVNWLVNALEGLICNCTYSGGKYRLRKLAVSIVQVKILLNIFIFLFKFLRLNNNVRK
jgi:hypothetical protein